MKKFLKVFIPIAIIVGGLALAICYMVIPEETKSAADIVVGYLNTPLFIASGTTVTIGLVVGVVIKVVYDRYKNSVDEDLELYKNKVQELVNQAKDYEKLAEEHYQYADNLIKEIKEKETIDYDYLVELVTNICETFPNKKINAIGQEIKNKTEEAKKLEEEVKKGIEEYGGEERTND